MADGEHLSSANNIRYNLNYLTVRSEWSRAYIIDLKANFTPHCKSLAIVLAMEDAATE